MRSEEGDSLPAPALRTSAFTLPPFPEAPQIVLTWLLRLRWLAAVGQVLAIAFTAALLGLRPPAWPVAGAIAATLLSQVFVRMWSHRRRVPGWVVPGILALDVGLLTVLLYCTGGPENPFRILYLVHVAMAVVVLGFGWTWLIVGLAAGCYGALYFWHLPLMPPGRALPPGVREVGDWMAVVLVSVLIAYFIGRVIRALRDRERERDAELAAARERAGRNEQLASLTTLAAGAAHELGSPLGTIAIVAKELQNDLAGLGRPDAVEDARLIRQEVDRCRTILDRMRVDIVEEGHHERSPVSVAELVDWVRADLGREQAAALRVEVPPDAALPATPARAVRQALVVMLNNAFDATREVVGEAGGGDRPVTLRVGRNDGHVEFAVDDAGGGMTPEVLRRAGEPFFTTKPPGSGMGLGLYLVRLVAEKYGGSFRMTSTLGRGTRATLELPYDVRADDGKARQRG